MYNATYLLPNGNWQKIAAFESKQEAYDVMTFHTQFKNYHLIWPINAETDVIVPFVLKSIIQLNTSINEVSALPQTEYTKDLISELRNAITNISDSLCYEDHKK
jgi:hypothetical protein